MNLGAGHAQGDVLYFLHADSYPPPGFTSEIIETVLTGNNSGSFRLDFDNNHWFLKMNCWFTRFDVNAFRYGDQSLFVTKACFQAAVCLLSDLPAVQPGVFTNTANEDIQAMDKIGQAGPIPAGWLVLLVMRRMYVVSIKINGLTVY